MLRGDLPARARDISGHGVRAGGMLLRAGAVVLLTSVRTLALFCERRGRQAAGRKRMNAAVVWMIHKVIVLYEGGAWCAALCCSRVCGDPRIVRSSRTSGWSRFMHVGMGRKHPRVDVFVNEHCVCTRRQHVAAMRVPHSVSDIMHNAVTLVPGSRL